MAAVTAAVLGGAGDRIDFEPYPGFLSVEDTAFWFRAWTGNEETDGREFRVFGQDGSGGFAAFWLVRAGRPLAEQPVVHLGSEGGTAVVARDLAAFLWLPAGGCGPAEAAEPQPCRTARTWPELLTLAAEFAAGRRQSPAEVIEEAAAEFPGFDGTIQELCR
ncbi:hypothetical protein AMK19_28975 [Kitasatospora sp. CB01950]|nr:hypothetical protein AMK19_28975 [Kitasatospora sp. CB01950]